MSTWVGSPAHLAQAKRALAKANSVRSTKVSLFKDLREDRISLLEAMEHPSVANMSVGDFFRKRYLWGPVKTRKLLIKVSVGDNRKMKDLTDRQKLSITRVTN